MNAAAFIKLHGIVQGVGFRFFAESKAKRLSLNGFARNEDDGSLTIYVEGERESIAKFIDEVSTGPRLARVSNIEVSWKNFSGEYDDFYIERFSVESQILWRAYPSRLSAFIPFLVGK
ncbi:MAG: acylphosphatase [Thermoprotei archaeon]